MFSAFGSVEDADCFDGRLSDHIPSCSHYMLALHLPTLPHLLHRYIFPIWALGLYRRLVLLGQERDPQGDAWLCAVSANVASSANC